VNFILKIDEGNYVGVLSVFNGNLIGSFKN
jgi:hypothetical protein